MDLGFQTDLFFEKQEGIIEEKDHYFTVRSPKYPDRYSGNLLLLKDSPTNAEKAELEALFAKEIGVPPTIKHVQFCWSMGEKEESEIEAFTEDGYDYTECSVLLCRAPDLITPPQFNTNVTIRTFNDPEDWEQWLAIEIAERETCHELETYKTFLQGRIQTYQSLIAGDAGNWHGAFLDGELVGTLGLFFDGNVGRFQEVRTKENFRNRGICRTLVHNVCLQGFQRTETLVMLADENYHAARLYESLGFKAQERQASLCRYPRV